MPKSTRESPPWRKRFARRAKGGSAIDLPPLTGEGDLRVLVHHEPDGDGMRFATSRPTDREGIGAAGRPTAGVHREHGRGCRWIRGEPCPGSCGSPTDGEADP